MYDQSQLKEIIDKTLSRLSFEGDFERLVEPVRYSLSVGGKRLRPLLTLMACNMYTDNISDAIEPAAGIEVFHNFTLVHDDVMDNASLRRNFPTVYKKWGLNQAILSGDVMAFIATEYFLQLPVDKMREVLKIFNETAIQVCHGQQLDMDYERSEVVMENDYMRLIELKTAVLLAASVKIGAIIGGANDKEARLLYDFGENIGLAFQIQDDLLDIWSKDKIFGKMIGGDIVANKKTLPIIKAFETASSAQLTKLKGLFAHNAAIEPETKIREVTDILDQLNIKEKLTEMVRFYLYKALDLLDKVNVEKSKKSELIALTDSLIGRNF